ncbi:MAG: PQQ-binding-like beta-propeller repeat protein [Planctomycetaceae bacterium]|nr:PQQ-binding-like beta-propeller repeat protein [Planctomycetaceae bacterium]
MLQRCLLLGLCLVIGTAISPAKAQRSSSLIAPAEANRFGLERAWFTRVQFDSARGRIEHLRQHVSSKYGYTVHEVISARGRTVITDRDVDRFGKPLGKEGAQQQANKLVQQFTRSGIEAEIKSQVLPEITIYVVSDSGVVQAIDGETGRTRWSTAVGNPRYPTDAPGANDDYVAVVNGTTLYLLGQKTGGIAWQRQTLGAPGAGPAISDERVFVPMAGGTIEAYAVNDGRQPPWVFQSRGRAIVQPVIAGSGVAWPTDKGDLYVAEANLTGIRYRLETKRPIVARPTALPPNRIVVVSTDGYVNCIHESSGGLVWRFSTGEPIVKPAVAIGDALFVVTNDDNLFRLSAETGMEQWWAPRVREVISATKNRLYCLGDTGRLVLFDLETGGRVGELPTEQLDVRMVNFQTDRIFLGTSSGMIQCLREVDAEWPTIRSGGLEEKPKDEKGSAAKEEDAAAEEEPDAAPAADPFGAFGTEPAAGATETTGDPFADPFGSF